MTSNNQEKEEFPSSFIEEIYFIPEKKIQVAIEFSGKNSNQLCLILDRPYPTESAENQLLSKILGAVNCQLEESAIVVAPVSGILSIQEIIKTLKTNKIIIFADQIPFLENFKSPRYEIFKAGNVQIMLSAGLATLNADVNEKKRLWNVMKTQLFA